MTPKQAETRGVLTRKRREPHKVMSIYPAFLERAVPVCLVCWGASERAQTESCSHYRLEQLTGEYWTCQSIWKLKGKSKKGGLARRAPLQSLADTFTLKQWMRLQEACVENDSWKSEEFFFFFFKKLCNPNKWCSWVFLECCFCFSSIRCMLVGMFSQV